MAQTEWDWSGALVVCRQEARRVLRDPDDAEDAAQEAVLRAWRASPRCQAEDPGPWLRRIARNEAFRLRGRISPAVPWEGRHASSFGDTDRSIEQIDVRSAVRALPLAERIVVSLRYHLDLTQPAAAAALGLPEGTVKVRLHRARNHLKARLTSYP